MDPRARHLGDDFPDRNVIGVGLTNRRLDRLMGRASEELMDDHADELQAFAAAGDLFVNQFDEWRDYLKDAADDPSPVNPSLVIEAGRVLEGATEILAQDVTEPLRVNGDLAADEPESLTLKDHTRGIGNIITEFLNIMWGVAKSAGGRVVKGSLDGLEEGTKKFVIRAVGSLGLLSTPAITEFVLTNQVTFGWVPRVLEIVQKAFQGLAL